MKKLETILKEHGITEYDVRTNAAVAEYLNQFPVFHQTPTEAEINEAAEKQVQDLGLIFGGAHHHRLGFKSAIQWLQNYQTQQIDETKQFTLPTDKECEEWYNLHKPLESKVESAEDVGKRYLGRYECETIYEQAAYLNGFIQGANWQASQPNPAIAVIESEMKKLIGESSEPNCEILTTLDGILKQIKP